MGLVRSYRGYLRNFIFSLHIICIQECFIPELPVLYFRSPDDIATKKYG